MSRIADLKIKIFADGADYDGIVKMSRNPAVKGFTLTQAISLLADAGLKANPVPIYSAESPNTVLAQQPKAGANVLAGSKIRINFSRGPKPVSVPNVVGDPFPNAVSALRGAGFVITRNDIDSEAPKGQVVAQDPLAGAQVPNGSKVVLSVSKGPALSQVPDVTGQTEGDAKALLAGAGYKARVQRQPVTDPSQDGLVTSQNPVGGTPAKKGVGVRIVVGRLTAPPAATTTTSAATTTTPATTTPTTTTPATTTTATP